MKESELLSKIGAIEKDMIIKADNYINKFVLITVDSLNRFNQLKNSMKQWIEICNTLELDKQLLKDRGTQGIYKIKFYINKGQERSLRMLLDFKS